MHVYTYTSWIVTRTYHAILCALDSLVNNLPARALQGAQIVAVVRPLADNLLQRQVAMGEDGLAHARAFAGRDHVHLVHKRRRRVAICAPSLRRPAYSSSSSSSSLIPCRRHIVLLAQALLRDERRLTSSA